MRIAFLQVGEPRHGICRYGRTLAAEARRRADLDVVEENLPLSGDARTDRGSLERLGRQLSDADVVHLQVTPWGEGSWGCGAGSWTSGWRALRNLRSFRRRCRAPLVITLHDAAGLAGLDCGRPFHLTRGAASQTLRGLQRLPRRVAKRLLRRAAEPTPLFEGLWSWGPLFACALARAASRAASSVLVLTGPERKLLEVTQIAPHAQLIPHYVADAGLLPDVTHVGSSGQGLKTLIVAGFIFHSKGHRIVLEAMQLLPEVRVVFVGGQSLAGFGASHYASLMDLALEKGVQDRLEVTGYLPDAEYQQRLASADLAVCPFDETKSASGSLSTLIASGCPVLASDIPLIAEYNALVPGAVATFSPRTPEALAAAVRRVLAIPHDELTRGQGELRKRLSLAAIFDQHLQIYQRLLGSEVAVP
jgi:glycosyltransferase involved in cell wall biosynthesis